MTAKKKALKVIVEESPGEWRELSAEKQAEKLAVLVELWKTLQKATPPLPPDNDVTPENPIV